MARAFSPEPGRLNSRRICLFWIEWILPCINNIHLIFARINQIYRYIQMLWHFYQIKICIFSLNIRQIGIIRLQVRTPPTRQGEKVCGIAGIVSGSWGSGRISLWGGGLVSGWVSWCQGSRVGEKVGWVTRSRNRSKLRLETRETKNKTLNRICLEQLSNYGKLLNYRIK